MGPTQVECILVGPCLRYGMAVSSLLCFFINHASPLLPVPRHRLTPPSAPWVGPGLAGGVKNTLCSNNSVCLEEMDSIRILLLWQATMATLHAKCSKTVNHA